MNENNVVNPVEEIEVDETSNILDITDSIAENESNDSNVVKWIIRGVAGAVVGGGVAYGVASGSVGKAIKFMGNRCKEAKIKNIRIKKIKKDAHEEIRKIRKEKLAMSPEELEKELTKKKEKEITE